MGSSSQHYRDIAPSSTQEWENVTANSDAVTQDVPWLREPSEAAIELRWVWDVHVYGLASLFSVLCVLALLTVLRLNAQLSERPHLSSLNVFLGILAASRMIVLFADPYGSTQALPVVMLQVLWDLGYPCLVSAFALLQLSFVRMTQVKMSRINDESALTIIITFHFCLIITSGVLGALQHSLRILWLVTQVAFVVWGAFLCLSSLLGCVRLLRSIVKVPLHFLRQVDPGYEISSIVPPPVPVPPFREMSAPPPPPPSAPRHPRIRITDVNEQTHSYASDASLTQQQQQQLLVTPTSESYPVSCVTRPSSPGRREWKSQEAKTKQHTTNSSSSNEDPALFRPLISLHHFQEDPQDGRKEASIPVTISTVQTPQQQLSPLSQIRVEEFQFDSRKLKRQSRSRLEKQLRRLVCTAALGVALCLLKACDIFDGLLYRDAHLAILPWFCFQTVSRIVEFVMAYSMVSMSQQSLNSHYYYYYNNN